MSFTQRLYTLCLISLFSLIVVPGQAMADDSLIITDSGNVGIGHPNPPQQLSLTGGIGFANANATDKKLYSPADGTLEWMTHNGAGEHGFAVSHQGEKRVYLNTNGVSYFMGGNVGIGHPNPPQQLSLTGGIGFANANATDKKLYSPADGTLEWMTHNGAGEHGFAVSHQGEKKVYLNTNGVSYFMGGNVGIGTTNCPIKFVVKADEPLNGAAFESNDGWVRLHPATLTNGAWNNLSQAGDSGIIFSSGSVNTGSFVIAPWATATSGIKISQNGSVGINRTADSTYALDVNGVIRAESWTSYSDARWKENIDPIENALDKVTRLRGVTYNWIEPSRGDGRQIGVIAQEVEEIFPEVVHTDSQGYKSVEYAKLVAPLIEAVKELKNKNESLEQRNSELEKRLAAIEAMIAK